MRAIISDVHSNLEALQAVLTDIERYQADDIYCLGDVVGYGPDPCECLEIVMEQCKVVLLGNHDEAVLFDTMDYGFNPAARQAILWTRKRLEESIPDRQVAERRLEFLKARGSRHQEEGFVFVHGSPCNPIKEYVFPDEIYNFQKMRRLFAEVERGCFMGHSHIPGIFIETRQNLLGEFHSPEDLDNQYVLDGRKFLCNVGSVGQPRDGDCRACYILFDGTTICFRRIAYDIDATVRKIHGVRDLARSFGDRLLSGR